MNAQPGTLVLVSSDLLFGSRVLAAAARAGQLVLRVDDPAELPTCEGVSVVLVDWAARAPDWGQTLTTWCAGAPQSAPPRIILFGPHTDLAAHADARASGLGPMWARSKLLADLPRLSAGNAQG